MDILDTLQPEQTDETKHLVHDARCSYKDLVFEQKAPRGSSQKRMFYDQHLARLKNTEWDRAPTPDESFSVTIDHLNGTLPAELKHIAEDKHHGGEYFCHCWIGINTP